MKVLGAAEGHVFEWVTVRRAVVAIAVAVAIAGASKRTGLVALEHTAAAAAVRAAGAVEVERE